MSLLLLSSLPGSQPASSLTRLADAGGLPALEAQRRAESAPLPALLYSCCCNLVAQHTLSPDCLHCIPQTIPHVWRAPPPPKLHAQTVGTASLPARHRMAQCLASHGCMQQPLLPAYDERDRLPGPDACTWVLPLPRACCRTSTCVKRVHSGVVEAS